MAYPCVDKKILVILKRTPKLECLGDKATSRVRFNIHIPFRSFDERQNA